MLYIFTFTTFVLLDTLNLIQAYKVKQNQDTTNTSDPFYWSDKVMLKISFLLSLEIELCYMKKT